MNHLGYYLQFKDGVDEKFQEIKDSLSNTPGLYGIDDVDLFKKMVKAELVTKYPNLGGAISEEDEDTKFQGAIKVRRITPNKAIGEVRNTGAGESTAGDIIYTENTEGDAAEEQYVLALSAEHNTDDLGPTSVEGDLKAGEMNVIVAEYVRQMLSKYPQIQVVQTGSTSENRNVPEAGRWQAAVDNQADMVIGIDFNMTQGAEELEGENGVSVLYNTQGFTDSGTYITGGSNRNSHTLGEILKVTVATKLTLEVTDDEVGHSDTIGYGNNPDIPSVIVKGGYLTGDKDYDVLKEEEALVDYAEGIVDAILQYWDIPYNGYGAISTEESTVTTDVESHVRDLTYITPERFDELVNTGNAEVLEYFTLDEDFNIVTASWSYDNGTTTFNKSTKNYRSLLENYTMPFEYLLFLLINSGRDDFVDGLAEEVMNAEIILAIEDNVTTTQIDYNEYTKHLEMWNNSSSPTDIQHETETEWDRVASTRSVTETCTSNVEITYAKTWCVIYSKDLTFSDSELGVDDGERVDIITNIQGTTNSTTTPVQETIAGDYVLEYSIRVGETSDANNDEEAEIIYRYYFSRDDTLKKTDTLVISNRYNTGSTPEIEERSDTPFVVLYNRLNMTGSIHNSRLFRILEKNEKTADMVDLTKYLLYLATGTSIDDIKEFPEEQFSMGSFSPVSGGSGILEDYLHAWENGALFNYLKGNASYSDRVAKYITEDKTQYVCYTDGEGRLNFGFGVCHYYSGRFNHVELYASVGVDITQYNQVGMTLDVETVDRVKSLYLDGVRQSINDKLSRAGIQLEEHQVNGLIPLAYQWGDHIINDFITAYQQYGDTEELRYNFANGNDHRDKPFLNGDGSSGLDYEVQRGTANWTVFHEGRYLLPDGGELNPSDYSSISGDVGDLVEQNSNGIYGVYTSSKGKTFIEYRQCSGPAWGDPPWKDVPYWDGTISSDGCGPTSAAIALTGYGVAVTPADVANAMTNRYGSGVETSPASLTWAVNNFGVSAHYADWGTVNSADIANNLNQGRPVLISVGSSPNTMFTRGGHLMALIDIDGNNNVYVSNPSTTAHGWIPLSTVIQYCSYKWAVYFDE